MSIKMALLNSEKREKFSEYFSSLFLFSIKKKIQNIKLVEYNDCLFGCNTKIGAQCQNFDIDKTKQKKKLHYSHSNCYCCI